MKPPSSLWFFVAGMSILIFGACASSPTTAPATTPAVVPPAPTTNERRQLGDEVDAPMGALAAPAPAKPVVALPAPAINTPAPAIIPANATADNGKVDFNRQVKQFFADYCYECHGLGKSRGGVRLDVKANAMMHITAGDPTRSDVYRAITRSPNASDHMPPASADQPEDSDIAMIKQWITEGAQWPDGL